MSTTVHEALLNAQINMGNVVMMTRSPIAMIAKSQLDNALTAIENGMALDDVIHESMFDDVKTGK